MITRFPIRFPYRIPFGSVAHRSDLMSANRPIRLGQPGSQADRPVSPDTPAGSRRPSTRDWSCDATPPPASHAARCRVARSMLWPKRCQKSPRRGGTGPKNTMRFTFAGCASAYDAASSGPYECATSVTFARSEVPPELVEVLDLARRRRASTCPSAASTSRRRADRRRSPCASRRAPRSRRRSTRDPSRDRRGSR